MEEGTKTLEKKKKTSLNKGKVSGRRETQAGESGSREIN